MLDNLLFIAATEASAGGESGIVVLFDKFGLDARFLIAQIINFVIVAAILYKFAFKPVLATIEERQKTIAEGLEFSEEAKAKLADSEKQHAATLQKAQQEAQAILAEARDNAKALMDKQAEEASARSEDMITKGQAGHRSRAKENAHRSARGSNPPSGRHQLQGAEQGTFRRRQDTLQQICN